MQASSQRARTKLWAQAAVAAALLAFLPAPAPAAQITVMALGQSLPPPSVDPCDGKRDTHAPEA